MVPNDVCTDCDGTGITKQTERRCACQPPRAAAAATAAIISDEEIERVHGYANFGAGMTKRQVVTEGVIKYWLGFTSGSTQLDILLDHGLVRIPKPGSYKTTLTAKGRGYLRAALAGHIHEIARLADHG